MSTEFRTEPPIEYAVFLAATELKQTHPERPIYTMPHMLLGTEEGERLWVFEHEDGSARFERFGRARELPVLSSVRKQFGVDIYDYCELRWPEDYLDEESLSGL
jgi:hypothetical protein